LIVIVPQRILLWDNNKEPLKLLTAVQYLPLARQRKLTSFPERGMAFWRCGWGRQDLAVLVGCSVRSRGGYGPAHAPQDLVTLLCGRVAARCYTLTGVIIPR